MIGELWLWRTRTKGTRKSGFKKCGLLMERSILMAKRGPTTPVPSWRAFFPDLGDQVATRPDIVFSARKLASALWELQEIPTSTDLSSKASAFVPRQEIEETDLDTVLPSSPSISCNPSLKTLKCASHHRSSKSREPLDLSGYKKSRSFCAGTERLSQLMEVLSHTHNLEECKSSKSLVIAWQWELEHAQAKVQDMALAQRAICKELNEVLKKSTEERSMWHRKVKERLRSAIRSLKKDVEEERKSRHWLEGINTSLGRELGEVNLALSRVLTDLERERKLREMMEDVCDELAREIGVGKSEVEELRVASTKFKEEIEEERKMLQMADVWREERVQMKLSDAKLQLQGRNSALDRLKGEVEEFLGSRRALTGAMNACDEHDIRKGMQLQAALDAIHRQGKGDSFSEAWQMDGAGFIEYDLHSIGLNKEVQYSRGQNCKIGHPESTVQAMKVNQTSFFEPDDSFKEPKRKSRHSRIVNRAKYFVRSRSFGCAEEPITENSHGVGDGGSAADSNQSRGTVTDPEKIDQALDSSSFEGRTSNSSSDEDNESSSVHLNVEENVPSEHSQSDRWMAMHQAGDVDYGLHGDTYAWGLDFSTSGGTFVNDDSPVQSLGRESSNLHGEHSVTTPKDHQYGFSTLTSLSPEKPMTINKRNSRPMAGTRQHNGSLKPRESKQLTHVYMKNRKVS